MSYAVRLSSLMALFLALVSGAALFWVSQQVQQVEREQRQLQNQVMQEEEALRVLRAEWDYLNNPERLEALANKYLNMAPVSADTLVQSISTIPEPEDVTTAPLEISTQGKPMSQAASPVKPLTELPSPTLNENDAVQENNFNQVLDKAADNDQ